MKYKIEKNTVQETLIIPLYARKVCSELYPTLYRDETSIRLLNEIDYDFSEAEQKSRSLMQRFGALEVAMRQNDLAFEVRDYLKTHPNAAVVNLGCGLDSTGGWPPGAVRPVPGRPLAGAVSVPAAHTATARQS